MRSVVELAITTGQAVRAVKRSIYFDVYGQTERSCARMGRRASHNLVLEKTRLVYKL